MKILYLSQTFPPEPGATARPLKQAAWLQRLGHEVTVVTSMPYYPLGRVFPGYRGRLILREEKESVEVIRIWSFPAANRGSFRRLASYASFALGAAITGLSLGRRDLVIASVPHPATELAGLIVARLKGSAFLLELRDLLPDNLLSLGLRERSFSFRAIEAYFRRIFRWTDLVAVTGREIAAAVENRGVAAERVMILPHATDREQIEGGNGSRVRREHRLEGKFVALYAGSFAAHYGIPGLLEAADRLRQSLPRFCLLLIGTGQDAGLVKDLIARRGLSNVVFAGAVPHEQVCHYLNAADLFLSPYGQRVPVYRDNVYTKACEYLMAGKPIVSIENGAVLGGLLRRIGAGFSVPPDKPDDLAEAIAFFAAHPEEAAWCGQRAREFARRHLDRKKVMAAFESDLTGRLRSIRLKGRRSLILSGERSK